ncbi:MAG: SH3 domain-containing protein [Ardenticatenaceae bacterium]|nr:SH3 domain-containing protein [Ardenticatenaceae bacterium]MCB8988569.1 SH3 domain-containing protein [Ardenticatenaceae bacterium]
MRKIFRSPLLYLVILLLVGAFVLAPVQTSAAQDRAATGIVTTGALNVRSGPGPEYSILTTAYQGHALAVLGRSGFNTWVEVRTFAGIVGWANANYMQMDVPLNNLPIVGTGNVPPGTTPVPSPAIGVVNTGAVNVRTGPGYGYPIVTIAYQGYTFTLLGRTADNAWAKVRMVDGTEGWVNTGALNTNVPIGSLPIVNVTAPPTSGPTAVVNTGALNVRSGPGIQYPAVAATYNGHVVTMLGRNADGSWVKVRLFNGQEGWVNARYITPNSPIANLPVLDNSGTPPTGATAVVNTGALNVRSGPGPQFPALTSVPYGTTMSLIGRNYDATWAKVRLTTGVEGWVNASFIVANVAITSLPIADGSGTVPAATVNTGALNVRSGPGVNFSVLEVIYQGTRVSLLGRTADSSWVQIQTPKGTTGWVNASLLQANVPISNLPVVGGTTPPPVTTNAVVTTGALNVRSGPGLAFPAVTTVYNGDGLTLIGRSATAVNPPWVQVRLQNGLVGWVNANYIYTTVPLANLPVTG